MLDLSYRQPLIDLLCQFVRIPSHSDPSGGCEGHIQRLMADEMRSAGAQVRMFEPAECAGFFEHPYFAGPERSYRDRPTVIGEIGPDDTPALLILAHSDTVPVYDRTQWTFDPLLGEVHDGKILGRGVCDDKWGLASMIMIMRALQETRQPLKRKLIFASTIDEEHGVGNGTLLLHLAGIKAEAALYLDGQARRVCTGNLGGSNFYLRPKNGLPTDTLSEVHAATLRQVCETMSHDRACLFDAPLLRDNTHREKTLICFERRDDQGPYFMIGFYTLPGEDGHACARRMEFAIAQALGDAWQHYETSYRQPWFEASLIPPDTPLVRWVAAATHKITGHAPVITTISKQDCFVLNKFAAIPTVAFGASEAYFVRGAMHQPDEALTLDELWQACNVAYETIQSWLHS